VGLLRASDLDRLAGAPFTYPDVGGTRSRPLPDGYAILERESVVGTGRQAFERAAAALFDWRAQRGVGLRVRASGPASEVDVVVVLTAGWPRLGYDMPCRVVWAQPGGNLRGFGYGTLPGHPESGEEAFTIRLGPGGDVVFATRVFSRLATPMARFGGPVSRLLQRAAIEGYVGAIRRATRG